MRNGVENLLRESYSLNKLFIRTKWILVRQPDALFVDIGPAIEYTRRIRSVTR